MLQAMRKHAKFFYIFFFIIILSFIFWGVGTVDKTTAVYIAEIGKEKINVDDYWNAYERTREFYRTIMKENFSEEMEKKLNLKQKVLDSLVDETVLVAEAKKAGIKVSDAEVEEAIVNDATFMRDGKFNNDIYIRALQLSRLTPERYEALKRKDLTINKMRKLIGQAIDVTDADMPQAAGGEQGNALRQSALNEMREKAIKSYIDGLKKQMNIKINQKLMG